MERKVSELQSDFERFQQEWKRFLSEQDSFKREFQELRKEVGAGQGSILADQVQELEKKVNAQETMLNTLVRQSDDIYKLLLNNEIYTKEVMQALAVIYRNVDGLDGEIKAT